jgi:hypothetical protein
MAVRKRRVILTLTGARLMDEGQFEGRKVRFTAP